MINDRKPTGIHGDLGTFIVQIQDWKKCNWQGNITWIEENKTVSFQSAWEMVDLIADALSVVFDEDEEEEQEASWGNL